MHTHTHTHTHTSTHTCTFARTHTSTHAHTCMHTRAHARARGRPHTRVKGHPYLARVPAALACVSRPRVGTNAPERAPPRADGELPDAQRENLDSQFLAHQMALKSRKYLLPVSSTVFFGARAGPRRFRPVGSQRRFRLRGALLPLLRCAATTHAARAHAPPAAAVVGASSPVLVRRRWSRRGAVSATGDVRPRGWRWRPWGRC